MDTVKIGIQGYKIKQELHEGFMTLHLIFSNPNGSCETYADFLSRFEDFLEINGYSFKPQSLLHDASSNIRENSQRNASNF